MATTAPAKRTALAAYNAHAGDRAKAATAQKRKVRPEDVDVSKLKAAMAEAGDAFVPTDVERAALDAKPSRDAFTTPSRKRRKKPKYDDEVRFAAKRAKELLGGKHAPGPKQHLSVRKVIGDRDPAAYVGLSASALKKFAETGHLAKDKRGKLDELAARVGDPWARGRSLAAILTALVEERKP
jgi:hypothetical protein